MSRTLKFIVLLFCSCVAVPAVYAQKECTLQTLTGTYAVYEKGASSFLNLNPPPSQFPYFSGVTAPLVNVGELTFSPAGVGTCF
jgi:hypothetical protein